MVVKYRIHRNYSQTQGINKYLLINTAGHLVPADFQLFII